MLNEHLRFKITERNNFRGVLLEKMGSDVRPASQNPYPIYYQNLRFSAIFPTLFMTIAACTVALSIIYEGFLLKILPITMKEKASSKKHTQLKTRVQKPYPIYDQNG